MSLLNFHELEKIYPNRIIIPTGVDDIPKGIYLVYILSYNSEPLIIGHGRQNRAKVIFDDINRVTTGHIKALFVRLYRLFGDGVFKQFIIECLDKGEAQRIEKNLHKQFGGNNRDFPLNFRIKLFDGLDKASLSYLLLEISLRSSFDGLSDLKKWYSDGIIDDGTWLEISKRLHL